MIQLNFPEPVFRTKVDKGRNYIFDGSRKKWLLLTPEEWVRQNFVQYLVQVMRYPASLIALEKEIMLGELKKRFDILVYNNSHQPWMIVECKAPVVNLTDDTLHQALRYNLTVPVDFILITNGHFTYGWQKQNGRLEELGAMPEWK